MSEIIFAVEQGAQGGYTAHALGESVFVEADTLEALRATVRDAVQCHFDDGHTPKAIRLLFARDERIDI